MLTVLVKMIVSEQSCENFRHLLLSNAATSLIEPGCHCFTVSEKTDAESGLNEFLLYEEYTDMDAFKAHLKTDHYRSFDVETANMLIGKDVAFYDLIQK